MKRLWNISDNNLTEADWKNWCKKFCVNSSIRFYFTQLPWVYSSILQLNGGTLLERLSHIEIKQSFKKIIYLIAWQTQTFSVWTYILGQNVACPDHPRSKGPLLFREWGEVAIGGLGGGGLFTVVNIIFLPFSSFP